MANEVNIVYWRDRRGPQCDENPEAGIFPGATSIFSAANPTDPTINNFSTTRRETVYSTAKLFSENLGLCYRRLYGVDFRGLRLAPIVGPGYLIGIQEAIRSLYFQFVTVAQSFHGGLRNCDCVLVVLAPKLPCKACGPIQWDQTP